MNAPFLKIDNLSKNYGETRALSEISLSLHTEELLVILGPTGAGKTTLLRIIAGLEAADTGRITVNGTDITHQLPAERDIALVFQNFSLYPNKTVRQNLEFPLQAPGRNLSKTDIANRISHTADLLRITPLLDPDPPRTYPAAKCSASQSDAPSCANPDSFSSTNPSPTWTQNCAKYCASNSSASSATCTHP